MTSLTIEASFINYGILICAALVFYDRHLLYFSQQSTTVPTANVQLYLLLACEVYNAFGFFFRLLSGFYVYQTFTYQAHNL